MRSAALIAALLCVWPASSFAQDEEPGGPRGPVEAEAEPEPGGPRGPIEAPEKPAIDAEIPAGGTRPFRLGLVNAFNVGFGGQLDNPSPSYHLGLDFAFPTGRRMRYHFEIAFQDLNNYTGLRFSPITLGYEIPIEQQFLPRDWVLTAEVMLTLCQADVLFDDGYAIALSSALRGQIILSYGMAFAALVPIGFEIRYAYGKQDVGIRSGFGANWPFYLLIGVEL